MPTSLRECQELLEKLRPSFIKLMTQSRHLSPNSKVWDTYSGTCLHTFSHNHIVRAVAIDSKGNQILTGGHEKKLRLFDLSRPEEEASYLSEKSLANGMAHDGNIKSVVWQRGEGEGTVVSAGEDKTIK